MSIYSARRGAVVIARISFSGERAKKKPSFRWASIGTVMRERSEGESGSELAGEGTWDDGAARVDEAERLEEAGGEIGDVDVVVGAVVGAVGDVERLVETLAEKSEGCRCRREL